MKKLFTFAIALMAAMAMNATDYYLVGSSVGWNASNETYKFVEVDGVLTVNVAELSGDVKVTENGNWHPQYGAASDQDSLRLNTPFVLTKCDDSQGEADAPANVHIALGANQYYSNAKLTLQVNDGVLTLTLVSGTLVDTSADPEAYFLVGAFQGWSLDAALRFEEVNGVLTVNVPDLNGGFKVLKAKASKPAWGNEYASNGAGVVLGEAYALQHGGENLALANPFGGYTNAVVTLAEANEALTMTLQSGTFYVTENDWFLPGAWNSWKCDDVAKMTADPDAENTYELLLAEFGGEFKVVYGQWAVEFGVAKNDTTKWELFEMYSLKTPCDNMKPADATATYQDVTISLTVDYENVNATLIIMTEDAQGVKTIQLQPKSIKRIENGQVLIERDGVRYNMNGAKQ